ncbi:MAG: carbohydrate porin [Prevotella sp.]|nr:carbohydrate porin [Prevotella sp.]
MKLRTLIFAAMCGVSATGFAQTLSGEYTAEWEWGMKSKNTNFVNLLRLDFDWSPWKNGTIEAATLSIARTNDPVIDDLQLYSSVYEENCFAAIAVLGYKHSWKNANLFVGVRNSNEDFFTSDGTGLFTSASPGIFPTIGSSYPIANYPVSSLNVTFDITFGNWTITEALYNGVGYNGWKKNDNPFLVRPKRDGVYDEIQVAYETEKSFYSVGAAMHSKFFTYDEDGDFTCENKFSAALWAYGEQTVWESEDDQRVRLMAQVSANTKAASACSTYAEVGCIYDYKQNTVGISGQYGRFHDYDSFERVYVPTDEYSVELTWHRDITEHIAIQPAFHYIRTGKENNTVLLGRFTYSF